MKKLQQNEILAIQALETANGEVTPKRIVNAARDPNHPLHNRFEWDDTIAGELYREDQARDILRIRTEIRHEETILIVPMRVHDPTSDQKQSYRRTEYLAQHDPIAARAVLSQTLMTARGHLIRAQELAVAFGLRKEFDHTISDLLQMENRLSTIVNESIRPA